MSLDTNIRSANAKGFTLIELVISIVIVSIAMVALLNAFGVSVASNADPLLRSKSLSLAQIYLDEALSKYYDHNTPVGGVPAVVSPDCSGLGPESGESRVDYNDVDDFNGTNDKPPRKQNGVLTDYDGYRVQVSVACVGADVGAASNNQVKKILVTVTSPDETQIKIASYKGNY